MALVRVYCGLASADDSVRTASAASPLTVAVVDDAGRLLGLSGVCDDPAGYAQLAALLVEQTSGFADAAVAADSDDHTVTSLLTAAGRPLVVVDDDTADDYAERFCDDESAEEINAPAAARRAVGLARALQAGAIAAVALPVSRELTSYKPVLAAHVAMLIGRQAAGAALREVLRELYPAALRAYPDPAHPLALAVLDALPEPGRLTARGADPQQIAEDVATELTRAGAGTEDQVIAAVTALTVAISESPRRGGVNKSLAPAAAETVRHAIVAVRSCDSSCEALLGTLAARTSAPPSSGTGRRAAGSRRAPEPTAQGVATVPPVHPGDTGTRIGRRSRPEPAATGSAPVTPRPLTRPPVAPEPVMPPPLAPRPVTPPPAAPAAAAGLPTGPANRPVSVPPPPPGMTPIVPGSRTPLSNATLGSRQRATGRAQPAANGATDYSLPMPAQRPTPDAAEPGARANWPLLNSSGNDDLVRPPAAVSGPPPPAGRVTAPISAPPAQGRVSAPASVPPAQGRVRPPWQDMPKEPTLRLVEQVDGTDSGGGLPAEPPPLRLVDTDDAGGRGGRATRRTTLTALDRSTAPPVPDEGDGDLLIFAAARSAWFTGQDDESADLDWTNPNDTGWRAAERASNPTFATETPAGLPKRVPQANLVPGSPLRDERPLRIVRDAASIAAHTTGYFRGWRRGQEIGGYAIGGRPGRESAGGWDFSRDTPADEYRNTGYRS
ncbi:MAG TPA: transposase [Actinoplanes sp.]